MVLAMLFEADFKTLSESEQEDDNQSGAWLDAVRVHHEGYLDVLHAAESLIAQVVPRCIQAQLHVAFLCVLTCRHEPERSHAGC